MSCPPAGRYGAHGLNVKAVGPVSVAEHGAAHAFVPNDGADAGERDVEAHRLRQLRREQAELQLAGAARFGGKRECEDCGLRRMGFEVEMEQLDPERAVVAGKRGPHGPDVGDTTFQGEGDGHRGEREDTRRGSQDELFQHDAKDKEQRLELARLANPVPCALPGQRPLHEG